MARDAYTSDTTQSEKAWLRGCASEGEYGCAYLRAIMQGRVQAHRARTKKTISLPKKKRKCADQKNKCDAIHAVFGSNTAHKPTKADTYAVGLYERYTRPQLEKKN